MLAAIFWATWIADYLLTSRSQHDDARWRAEQALAVYGPTAFARLSGERNAARCDDSRRETRLAIGYLIRYENAARRAARRPSGSGAASAGARTIELRFRADADVAG